MKDLLFVLVLSIYSLGVYTQPKPGEHIAHCFKTGNTKALFKLVGPQLDLTVKGEEHLLQKPQAQARMSTFFSNHPPTGFKVIHKGKSKGELRYTIGKLTTDKGNYRVSYFTKKTPNGPRIKQIRIDLE